MVVGYKINSFFPLQDKIPYDLAIENKNMYDAELILLARQKTSPRGLKEYLTRSPVSWQQNFCALLLTQHLFFADAAFLLVDVVPVPNLPPLCDWLDRTRHSKLVDLHAHHNRPRMGGQILANVSDFSLSLSLSLSLSRAEYTCNY